MPDSVPEVARDIYQRAKWPAAVGASAALYYSGLLGIHQRWRQARAAGRFLILMYHRVAVDRKRCSNLCVSPAHFRQHMRYLAEGPYRVVSLAELAAYLERGEPTETASVAVTFDDGYRDVFTQAFRVLQEYRIPATVFLTPSFLDSQQTPWWDRAELTIRTLRGLPEGRREADGAIPEPIRPTVEAALRSPNWRVKPRIDAVIAALKALEGRIRLQVVAALEERASAYDTEPLMMTWDMVRAMQAEGIAFGAHTVTHPVLSQLDAEETRREILGSRETLEAALGEPIPWFAYPHGTRDDFNEQTVSALRDCGFRLAVTTEKGWNDRNTDPLVLRRCGAPDVPAATLAVRLHHLLHV